jgi:hypothetical protein
MGGCALTVGPLTLYVLEVLTLRVLEVLTLDVLEVLDMGRWGKLKALRRHRGILQLLGGGRRKMVLYELVLVDCVGI